MKATKATEAQVRQRVEELLRIRLDGAELWDVREYVREKVAANDPVWGEKPLSDSQLYRYLERVDSQIAESCKTSRRKLIRTHLTRRRALFARAVNVGDLSTALRILADEAALLDLYPAKKSEISGKGGGPVVLNIVEEVVTGQAPAAMVNVVEEIADHETTGIAGRESPSSPGTASVHAQ